jgi:hypothetical protein
LEREGPTVLATLARFAAGEHLDGTYDGQVLADDDDFEEALRNGVFS